MTNYKITNITDRLGKREFKSNSPLEINMVSGMKKNKITLNPKDSVFLKTNSLPLSVHQLRVKGLITVTQVDDKEIPTPKKTDEKPKKKSKKSTSSKKSSLNKTSTKSSSSKRSSSKSTSSSRGSSKSSSSTTKSNS